MLLGNIILLIPSNFTLNMEIFSCEATSDIHIFMSGYSMADVKKDQCILIKTKKENTCSQYLFWDENLLYKGEGGTTFRAQALLQVGGAKKRLAAKRFAFIQQIFGQK